MGAENRARTWRTFFDSPRGENCSTRGAGVCAAGASAAAGDEVGEGDPVGDRDGEVIGEVTGAGAVAGARGAAGGGACASAASAPVKVIAAKICGVRQFMPVSCPSRRAFYWAANARRRERGELGHFRAKCGAPSFARNVNC
jgi:hypothetical protein